MKIYNLLKKASQEAKEAKKVEKERRSLLIEKLHEQFPEGHFEEKEVPFGSTTMGMSISNISIIEGDVPIKELKKEGYNIPSELPIDGIYLVDNDSFNFNYLYLVS